MIKMNKTNKTIIEYTRTHPEVTGNGRGANL